MFVCELLNTLSVSSFPFLLVHFSPLFLWWTDADCTVVNIGSMLDGPRAQVIGDEIPDVANTGLSASGLSDQQTFLPGLD